ncbi:MAG: ABC transporter permease [Oscillospiraceae bacterium]|nr:ABC transporter permease [Oscillospiraceae bacterium]
MNVARPGSLQLTAEDVRTATKEEKEQLFIMRETLTYWKDAYRRFLKNKIAVAALITIVLVALFAFVGPMLSPYTYDQQIRENRYSPPSWEHPFGTDVHGRDMLVRCMVGAQISLSIGVCCAVLVVVIGVIYGAISGYCGGKVDYVMMRYLEVLYTIPDVLVIILLQISLKEPLGKIFAGTLGSSMISIFVAFALLYWVNMARMVRGQVLLVKEMEYVSAARAMGAKGSRIIFRHLIPNSIGVILVTAMFQIPMAIFIEAFLSYIGLGVSAPLASLGSLSSGAIGSFRSYPHLLLFPAMLISLIILAFNLLGDGLRDALDPRLRSE